MSTIEMLHEQAQYVHPDLARGLDVAQDELLSALDALRNHQAGSTTWTSARSVVIVTTRNAIGAVDAVLSQFEDLPEPMLDALVGAANESRRLLEHVELLQSTAPGLVSNHLPDRYQRVHDTLVRVLA